MAVHQQYRPNERRQRRTTTSIPITSFVPLLLFLAATVVAQPRFHKNDEGEDTYPCCPSTERPGTHHNPSCFHGTTCCGDGFWTCNLDSHSQIKDSEACGGDKFGLGTECIPPSTSVITPPDVLNTGSDSDILLYTLEGDEDKEPLATTTVMEETSDVATVTDSGENASLDDNVNMNSTPINIYDSPLEKWPDQCCPMSDDIIDITVDTCGSASRIECCANGTWQCTGTCESIVNSSGQTISMGYVCGSVVQPLLDQTENAHEEVTDDDNLFVAQQQNPPIIVTTIENEDNDEEEMSKNDTDNEEVVDEVDGYGPEIDVPVESDNYEQMPKDDDDEDVPDDSIGPTMVDDAIPVDISGISITSPTPMDDEESASIPNTNDVEEEEKDVVDAADDGGDATPNDVADDGGNGITVVMNDTPIEDDADSIGEDSNMDDAIMPANEKETNVEDPVMIDAVMTPNNDDVGNSDEDPVMPQNNGERNGEDSNMADAIMTPNNDGETNGEDPTMTGAITTTNNDGETNGKDPTMTGAIMTPNNDENNGDVMNIISSCCDPSDMERCDAGSTCCYDGTWSCNDEMGQSACAESGMGFICDSDTMNNDPVVRDIVDDSSMEETDGLTRDDENDAEADSNENVTEEPVDQSNATSLDDGTLPIDNTDDSSTTDREVQGDEEDSTNSTIADANGPPDNDNADTEPASIGSDNDSEEVNKSGNPERSAVSAAAVVGSFRNFFAASSIFVITAVLC